MDVEHTRPGEVLVYPETERLQKRIGEEGCLEPTWVAISVRGLVDGEFESSWRHMGIDEVYSCRGKEECEMFLESHGIKFREIQFEPDWTTIISNGKVVPFFKGR